MPRIITIHSFRRGSGKSSLTANLATLLAAAGRSVGVVDMDLPAPSLQILFGVEEREIQFTLNQFLWGDCEIEQAAINLAPRLSLAADIKGKAWLIPASQHPGEISRVMRGDYYLHLLNDGFDRLGETLGLDTLLVDTNAGLTEETLMVFSLSDAITILLRNDQRDYQGTAVTVDVARELGVPRITIIVNETPGTFDFAHVRDQVAHTYNCDVIGVLPHSEDMAALASQGLFVLRHPAHPLTQALKDIALNLAT
jgi:MinD-like ATPase involved in chromosome partitioning or flagellar assembly